MVGWHHRLDGHAFEQALGLGDGQGGLAWCSPCGCKESDKTEQLKTTTIECSTLISSFQDFKQLCWNSITSSSFIGSSASLGPLDFTLQNI